MKRAVILAAGQGTRLRPTQAGPKCLLSIEGQSLLDRYVRGLDELGYAITVVAGYERDMVRERLAALAPRHAVTMVVNERFTLGSIVSLACALRLTPGPLLLLDGDVLFHPELLRRLGGSEHENALLVDIGSTFTTEEYMAGVRDGRVAELRRGVVTGHEQAGEWVGFAKLGEDAVRLLAATIEPQVAAGAVRGGYEDALASLLPVVDMWCVNASDLPWIEIDFPDDVHRAAALIRAGVL